MTNKKYKTYEDIRFRIITHDLTPGELLNEKELMSRYQIGRTPLRDVLILLERDGLIDRYPRLGTFVAPMDIHLLRQVVEIRLDLELLAVRLATERVSPEQIQEMHDLAKRADNLEGNSESDLDLLTHCEFDFHHLIYEATQNKKLSQILRELHGITARFWHYFVTNKEEMLAQFQDIGKMARALEKGDSELACKVMKEHMLRIVSVIKERVVDY